MSRTDIVQLALRHYRGIWNYFVSLSPAKSGRLKYTFSECLHPVYYLLYSGTPKVRTLTRVPLSCFRICAFGRVVYSFGDTISFSVDV